MTDKNENVSKEEKKGGGGLAFLSLLISLGGIGGGYFLYQQQLLINNELNSSISENARSFSNEQNAISQKINAAQTEYKQLINSAIESGLKIEEVKNEINQLLISKKLTTDDIKSIIQESLNSYAGGQLPRVDLSAEIEQWKNIRDENHRLLSQYKEQIQIGENKAKDLTDNLDEKVNEFNTLIQNTVKDVHEKMDEELINLSNTIKQQVNPEPVISALSLANIAIESGNYKLAVKYLIQAENAFNTYNLNQEQYSNLYKELTQLSAHYQKIANEKPLKNEIEDLIPVINNWKFQADKSKGIVEPKNINAEDSFWDKAIAVGTNVISNSIKVTENDDLALSWIDKNEKLQDIIRMNVRLDLAFLRNSLQINDIETAHKIAAHLISEIQKYFVEDEHVTAALSVLERVKVLGIDVNLTETLIHEFQKIQTEIK